ncbi:MAG: hypothetical protein QHJ81_00135 [Anaerolineae bacterium]|nr:hypothetical protein [Anaerolineae bacterium]
MAQNTGTETWRGPRYPDNSPNPHPIALSYRLYSPDGLCLANCDGSQREVLFGRTTVQPGESTTLVPTLHLPSDFASPHHYVIRWDMVQLTVSAEVMAQAAGLDDEEWTALVESTAAVNFWFSEQSPAWFTQDVAVHKCYIPLAVRNHT